MTPIEKLEKLLAEADESLERWRPFPIEMWPQEARTATSLLAALRTQGEQGWQDIATAPKDGTEIDIWRGGEFPSRVPNVSWREPSDSEWWVHGGDTIETPDAAWHDAFGPLGKDEQPTHWRPLPTPPVLES